LAALEQLAESLAQRMVEADKNDLKKVFEVFEQRDCMQSA
jgi:hypothetical protein